MQKSEGKTFDTKKILLSGLKPGALPYLPLRPEGRSYAKERGNNFLHHVDPLVRAEARCSSVFPLRPEGRSYAKKAKIFILIKCQSSGLD